MGKLRRRQSSSSPQSGRQGQGDTQYSVYTKPTNRLAALISEVAYNGQIVQAPSPCGENCTFTQSFIGPTYQCVEMDPNDPSAPWCTQAALSQSSYTTCSQSWGSLSAFMYANATRFSFYEASNSSADFCTSLSSNPAACNSLSTTQAWENGNIWVRYTYLPENLRPEFQGNTSVPASAQGNTSLPADAWQHLSYRCDQWDARFNLRRTYINSTQHVEVNTT